MKRVRLVKMVVTPLVVIEDADGNICGDGNLEPVDVFAADWVKNVSPDLPLIGGMTLADLLAKITEQQNGGSPDIPRSR